MSTTLYRTLKSWLRNRVPPAAPANKCRYGIVADNVDSTRWSKAEMTTVVASAAAADTIHVQAQEDHIANCAVTEMCPALYSTCEWVN